MIKRVLLVRGDVHSRSSSLYSQDMTSEVMLDRAKVPGWTKAITMEIRITKIPHLGSNNSSHKQLILEEIQSSQPDLLHITDQEQAHLVPETCTIPVVVTVHDMFHLEPRQIKAGDIRVPVGDQRPGLFRRRDLKRLKEGLARADLLICASEMTRRDVERMFPGKPTALVRHQIDLDYWDPEGNPRPRELIAEHDDDSKLLLITVGSDEPRNRLDFVREVITNIPEEVADDIHMLHIGSEVELDDEQLVAAFQHAEVLLFPSISEGFGYPPAIAMAAGCPVIAANLPTHNEVIPERCLLPETDVVAWVDEIVKVHAAWMRAGGVPRNPDDSIIDHVKNTLSAEAQGQAMAEAYHDATQGG